MIIANMNQKGGTGKTATTLNLGGILATQGKRILLVDADPQGSLSVCLDVDTGGMSRVIMNGEPIKNIITNVREHLDLAPTSIQLAGVDLGLLDRANREYRLRTALEAVKHEYDYILIDSPPSLAMMTVNCLAACQQVLIIMSCDYQALMSVQLLYQSIVTMKRKYNPDLDIMGLVRTRYDGRTNHSSAVSEKAYELFHNYFPVFDTIIRERTALKDAASAHKLITEYQPKGEAAKEYSRLTEEIFNYEKEEEESPPT